MNPIMVFFLVSSPRNDAMFFGVSLFSADPIPPSSAFRERERRREREREGSFDRRLAMGISRARIMKVAFRNHYSLLAHVKARTSLIICSVL